MSDSIYFCKVGASGSYKNGDMTIFNIAGKTLVFDINKSVDASAYKKIFKYARKDYNGYPIIDVLVLSHYDNDHIGDFEEIEKRINNLELSIHFIVHQPFDPRNNEGFDLDEHQDLKALFRVMEKIEHCSMHAGQRLSEVHPLIDSSIFDALCFTPSKGIDSNDINEMALGFLIKARGKTVLLPSDMSSSSWLRLDDEMLSKIKEAHIDYALLPHHGSSKFFDDSKSPAKNISRMDPLNLSNYGALDIINPDTYILSAEEDFPEKDHLQDYPPHYVTKKILYHWNPYQKIRRLAVEQSDICINLDNLSSISFNSSPRPYQEVFS